MTDIIRPESLDDYEKSFDDERKACQRFYRKHLKGRTIKDVHAFLSSLGPLHSVTLFLDNGGKVEITAEGIKMKTYDGQEIEE